MAKAKILYIDDSYDIQKIVTERLVANGYEVIGALNAELGIKLAIEQQPDLILLDVAMPETDGFSAGRQLRATLATGHIPIIMVTAKGEYYDRLKAISELKVQGYVTKPFNPKYLLEEIHRVLSESLPKKQEDE
ncbi:MAG: response regulator [Candidatus Omnitrophica bacterium]|nr:response regulator [Candidatus Omnitrophota bacterium]